MRKFYDAVGYKETTDGDPEVLSSQDKIRVRLFDKSANITMEGSNAPKIGEIYAWLRLNPTFEVVMPPKKQIELDKETRNQLKTSLHRKIVEVTSKGTAQLSRPISGQTWHKLVNDFENVLWQFNENQINTHYKECFARVTKYVGLNQSLLNWMTNGKLSCEHLVLMSEDDFKKVGTAKFIFFTPQSDRFGHTANSKKFGGNDILGSLIDDTTSGHGKTHAYSDFCSICKGSGDKSMLEAKDRQQIRLKAEIKTQFANHKASHGIRNFDPSCRFCEISRAGPPVCANLMRSSKCENKECKECEYRDLEEDWTRNYIPVKQRPVAKNDEVSKLLSSLPVEENEDDRLFEGGVVSGGAGLLNEVGGSDIPNTAPIDTNISLSLNAPDDTNDLPPSPVPVPNPREPSNFAPTSPPLDDGPPPLKKLAMSSPPALKSLSDPVNDDSMRPVIWEGNLVLSEERFFRVPLLPLRGKIEGITDDLPSQIITKGRIDKPEVFAYLDKVNSRQKLGIAVMELGLPRDERGIHLYREHYEFLMKKDMLGGTCHNPKTIREMYILALASHQAFPSDFGFSINLPLPRRNMLIAIAVREQLKQPQTAATRPLAYPSTSNNRHDDNRAMRKQIPQYPDSRDDRMSDIYRNVISNPGRPVNEILSAAPSSRSVTSKTPTERLYPESNSSSFPFFQEELVQTGSSNNSNSHYERGDRRSNDSAFTARDNASWNEERDSHGALPSGSSSGSNRGSILGRYKDDRPPQQSKRKSDEYLTQLYKPVERPTGTSPPPLPPDQVRPPLPSDPHPYHDEASERMKLEYGAASDVRSRPPVSRKYMGYHDSRDADQDMYGSGSKRPLELLSGYEATPVEPPVRSRMFPLERSNPHSSSSRHDSDLRFRSSYY